MKKRKIVLSLTVAAFLSVAAMVLTGKSPVVSDANEMIALSSGVTVTDGFGIGAEYGLGDDRRGMLLSVAASGSSVSLANEMAGLFRMDFRVFSEETFSGKELSGDTVNNPALALRTFTIKFADIATGKSFDVVIDGGSRMNYALPQASVRVNGKRVGVYLYEYKGYTYATSGNTTMANDVGRYTALYDTSFSNVAYSSWTAKADTVLSNVICFDPKTMSVYSEGADGYKTEIWDLSSGTLDGQVSDVLSPFAKYRVTFEFTSVAVGKTANMVVYEISGQSFAGDVPENNVGPGVYAEYDFNAVKGVGFPISAPITADVFGNDTESVKLSVRLNDVPVEVYDKNGVVTGVYTDGCYVVPDQSGSMDITYMANDGAFDGMPVTETVTVYGFEPNAIYEFKGDMEDGTYGKGTVMNIPEASVSGSLFRCKKQAFVTLKKDGEVIDGYERVGLPFIYEFADTGEYQVVYRCDGTTSEKIVSVSITDEIPAYNFSGEVITVSHVGERYEAPSGRFILNGEIKTPDVAVIFPDGSAFGGGSVTFAEPGLYRIEYSAKFGDTTYRKSFTIRVLDDYCGFTCNVPASGKITYDASNPHYAAQKGALLETDSENVYWTYDKVIDLSKSTKNDTLIQLWNGVSAFGWMYNPHIILTDKYDPTNQVTIKLITGWHQLLQVVRAQAPGQWQKGIGNDGAVYYGGNDTSGMGRYVFFPYQTEISPECPYLLQALWLSYDAEEKAIYTKMTQDGEPLIVIDLDAEYQDVLWKGFTTGEVYLTIKHCVGFVLTEVYGQRFDGKYYDDKVAPSIYIETGDYDENDLPSAVVGRPYKIFDAICKDNLDENVSSSVRVVYENGADLDVTGGKFTPKREGRYTMIYTAKDSFGNVSEKKIYVNAISGSAVTAVSFGFKEEPSATGSVGAIYEIPGISRTQGGIGKLTETITVTDPDGEPVAIRNGQFTPTKPGRYVLHYEVSDYVGGGLPDSATREVAVDISVDDLPIISSVNLPEAILSGSELVLPEAEAMDYSTNNNGVKTAVTVTAKINGSSVPVVGNVVTPKTDATADMTVSYSATNSRGTANKTYTVKVVKPRSGEGFAEDYFYVSGGAVDVTATETGVLLHTATDGSTVRFLNALLADSFFFSFTLPDVAYNNVKRINFRLRDYADGDICVLVSIIKNEDDRENSSFSYNNGPQGRIAGSLMSTEYLLGFQYLQDSLSIVGVSGSVAAFVGETESGEPFDGFPSGRVRLEMTFEGVTGEGLTIEAKTINNHNLNNSATDNVRPQGMVMGNIPRYIGVNTKCIIPGAVAQDVLSATVSVSFEIKRNGKTVLESAENEAVEYTFDQTGNYSVVYRISDASGRPLTPTYWITVVEYNDPEFTVNEDYAKTAKVGQEYVFPTYTVRDDTSTLPVVKIFVLTPDGSSYMYTDAKSFVPTLKGKYTIRFYCYDDYDNYVVKEVGFEAEE